MYIYLQIVVVIHSNLCSSLITFNNVCLFPGVFQIFFTKETKIFCEEEKEQRRTSSIYNQAYPITTTQTHLGVHKSQIWGKPRWQTSTQVQLVAQSTTGVWLVTRRAKSRVRQKLDNLLCNTEQAVFVNG